LVGFYNEIVYSRKLYVILKQKVKFLNGDGVFFVFKSESKANFWSAVIA
jgi:hypothetical protein